MGTSKRNRHLQSSWNQAKICVSGKTCYRHEDSADQECKQHQHEHQIEIFLPGLTLYYMFHSKEQKRVSCLFKHEQYIRQWCVSKAT